MKALVGILRHLSCGAVGDIGIVGLETATRLLTQLLDQLQRQGPARAFVTVNSRRHEHQVRSHQLPHQWKRNGGSLINDQKLSLSEDLRILGLNVLDCLTVVYGER